MILNPCKSHHIFNNNNNNNNNNNKSLFNVGYIITYTEKLT